MKIDENELVKRLMIHQLTFLTAEEKILLQTNIDSYNTLAILSIEELSYIIKRNVGKGFFAPEEIKKTALVANRIIQSLEIKYLFYEDDDFPPLLKEMKDPPYMLFYRGNADCLFNSCVSIAGTRNATPSGLTAAHNFAKDAGDSGFTVISGLAFGIDASGHKGALESNFGKTAAVLPCGIDSVVPCGNKKLAEQILKNGGVLLSEYMPGILASKFRYVQRNRILAALSPATVIIQSPSGGGAMLTAGFALDYNRYVFFHSACFDEQSEMLEKQCVLRLKMQSQKRKDGGERWLKNKLFNCPRRFVEEGASVINDFHDYCREFREDFSGLNKGGDCQLDFTF